MAIPVKTPVRRKAFPPRMARTAVTLEAAPERIRYDQTIVHLSCEYLPYAQAGGLAEAVRGMATEQARAGRRTIVFVPLYRWIREQFPAIEPAGGSFGVSLGSRVEAARVYRDPTTGPGRPEVFFVETGGHFDRGSIYGDNGGYADNHLRFAFFCLAALQWVPEVASEPIVIHAHDWHTALAPVFLRKQLAGDSFYDEAATLLTVHNAGYQGHCGPEVFADLGLDDDASRARFSDWHGGMNFLRAGLLSADAVTTVSPTHAKELLTEVGGFGLHDVFGALGDRFVGVLNSIDTVSWDPATDPRLVASYAAEDLSGKAACKWAVQRAHGLAEDPDVPLFVMAARLVEQKGLDLVLASGVASRPDAQWVFLGEGEARYREALASIAEASPERVACRFEFTEELERELLGGGDYLLMPSQYEPCGLTQMRAQRYGAVPVVRKVGGLADTVDDGITGIVFDAYEPSGLAEAVDHAIHLYRDRGAWEAVARTAMSRDFGFSRVAADMNAAYASAVDVHRARRGSGMS